MTALEAYILARAYTQQAIAGAGALKGAPCQIQSIIPITGGNRITFAWENSEGVTETDTLDVMDGVDGTNGTDGTDGTDGVGISSITFKEKDASGNNVYTVTLSNTNTYDITCPIGPQGETGSTGATGATGNGIASITKTGTEGLVDTYTITYTNGQTSTFTVTNGQTPTVDSAMSDSSANPVENRVIDAQLKTKANQTQLATVEASTTASKAYSANEYLVLGGVLYKVTDNIAQGGTIVTEGAGKNVDLATVGGELATLKSGLTNLSKGYFKASVTSGKWYKIADMTASTWIIHSGIIAIGGVLLKKFTFRYDATNHTFNNNFTKLESITGLPGYMAMKFGDNAVTLYYKAGQIGTATYSVLTDGEEGAVNYYNFVETDLTDADMDLIES